MSRLDYYARETTTPSALPSHEREQANKQRRKAGRERHEERKTQLKALEQDRKQGRISRDSQRQEKRPDDGTRPFAGRNLDNHRLIVSHLPHPASTRSVASAAGAATEGFDWLPEDEDEDEETVQNPDVLVPHATSGATLLAMARPAKVHRRQRRGYASTMTMLDMMMTDGERFEIVEIDGRLVALDEDGWEILPDENAEASLLYSDIVRGDVR